MNILDHIKDCRQKIMEANRALTDLEALLAESISEASKDPRVIIIQQFVCGHYHIPIELIGSTIRTEHVAWARHVAMALCCATTDLSPSEIACAFAKKEQATVKYARRRVNDALEVDANFRLIYSTLHTMIIDRFTQNFLRAQGELPKSA